MEPLAIFLILGGAALFVSFALAALLARRWSWLGYQAFFGVVIAVTAWKIAGAAGVFADEVPGGCSDCGEAEFFGMLMLALNLFGWVLGTALGGLPLAIRRSKARGVPTGGGTRAGQGGQGSDAPGNR